MGPLSLALNGQSACYFSEPRCDRMIGSCRNRLAIACAILISGTAIQCAYGREAAKTYEISLDESVFSIAVPREPDRQFARHVPAIALDDAGLFASGKSVVGLNLVWTLRTGFFRKVAAVVELRVEVNPGEGLDINTASTLQRQVVDDLNRGLKKINRPPQEVDILSVTIHGRPWGRYRVPLIGGLSYVTVLSDRRYLEARVSVIPNTSDDDVWRKEANELMDAMIASMCIRKAGEPPGRCAGGAQQAVEGDGPASGGSAP